MLMAVAFVLGRFFEGTAAGLCAAVFFVPSLAFLRHWRRLYVRDIALAHAARLADDAGVTDGKAIGTQLDLPEADATKILQTAVREGFLRGELDKRGRFVAATAPRCPTCHAAVPRSTAPRACPSCGASIAGGD